MEEIMSLVTDSGGKLIFDDRGGICLMDNQGSLHFVSPDRLPPNFLHDMGNYSLSNDYPEATSSALPAEIPSTVPDEIVPEVPVGSTSAHQTEFSTISHRIENRVGGEVNHSSVGLVTMETTAPASSNSDQIRAEVDDRAHWSREKILILIAAYKENLSAFHSNTIRNSEAWRRVAAAVPGFNPKQCETKFKYLKSLYIKRKDNMGNNSSGARAISFEYFDEFEEIFHKEPNVNPVATASSCRLSAEAQRQADTAPTPELEPENQDTLESSLLQRRGSRRKRTRLEIQLERFQRNMELREQAREARMERFLAQQEACTNRICDMMQKFIDKL